MRLLREARELAGEVVRAREARGVVVPLRELEEAHGLADVLLRLVLLRQVVRAWSGLGIGVRG